MQIKEIQEELSQGGTPPGRLAELLVLLSAKYAEASDELETILMSKPVVWNEIRKDHKTIAETDRAWEATEYGLAEVKWSMTLKKIEKMLGACRSMITVRTNEAHGNY